MTFSAAPIDTIVVTESAIDALSYCELHGHPGMTYVSTAGEFSDRQLAIVVSMAKAGARQVLSAFDDDTNGEKYHAKLIAALPATRRVRPMNVDWNRDLKDEAALAAGYREISEAEFLSQVTLHDGTSSQEEILCSR